MVLYWFLLFFKHFHSKTNVFFFTFLYFYNNFTIKPMVFQPFWAKTQQNQCFFNTFERKHSKTNGSLNSLSVRVPHNFSRRVLQTQGPNPLLEIGFTTLFFNTGFILVFALFYFFTIKPVVFFIALHFYNKNHVNQCFFNMLERKHSKTNGFSILLNENTIKPQDF